MNSHLDLLESIIERIGESVIASNDTVEKFAHSMNTLSEKIQQQEYQIEQQGYQIFALTETIQTLVDSQVESREQLNQVTSLLQTLVTTLNDQVVNNEK
ncbi:hypothetical protein [Aphanothece sacrum]|uniref:Rhamnose isomerase n=1 Tax=Aphanothece sacrum FPU1 TaxID=1920663 RepID=A0A401IME5_APHSA|nr:hypothetical protein [Aphanothece sacrum]GBF82427.1 rhamnose isomerase [Aphanothece sacrum FPU1]GBF84418.1 rhamnose isomerase [Aphanothece sacrum FPU3]